MSTREKALSIFNQLNEHQLEGFIAMFGEIFPDPGCAAQPSENAAANDECAQAERNEAFDEIEQIIKNKITAVSSDFDYKAEYLAYLDERYGV